MKRFVVPMSYLSQPLFHDSLIEVEKNFGFDHPMGVSEYLAKRMYSSSISLPLEEITSRIKFLCT